MNQLVKKLIRQKWINVFYHRPKGILASLRYNFPTRKLTVIGITGTDGKTTTVNMLYKILKDAGKRVSMVSTINAKIGEEEYDTGFHVTSPDSVKAQQLARQAVGNNDEYLILEVTSHALDQHRFWGIHFDIGVITNITHDHLDYHQTWQNYFLTKAKLIQNVRIAVLNKDEKHFSTLAKSTTGKVVSFGLHKDADFNPDNFLVQLNLPGEFNVANSLAAAAASTYLGIDREVIIKSLESFNGLEGRFEQLKNSRGINVIVDFAHTPNGLENILKTLRRQCKGRLISVFGAAGERDVSKRPLMGKVAQKLSDYVVITAEDPRGQLEIINQQIVAGAKQAGGIKGKNLFIINNRADAIEFAINSLAKKGDVVGIFGKGHEKTMNMDGKREIPWSDVEIAKKALWKKN